MNCKKGDLAVTRGTGRNSGRLVQCVEFMGRHRFGDGRIDEATWQCDTLGQVLFDRGGAPWTGLVFIEDRYLRPIRGTEGDDETLTWAGKPEKVTA